MATYSGNGLTGTFIADVDLSSYQYYLVAAASTAGKVKLSATAAGSIIGVLQDDPVAGEECNVVVFGPSKALASSEDTASPLTYGGFVKSGSGGKATGFANPDACAWAAGYTLQALASGSGTYVEMFVMPTRFV